MNVIMRFAAAPTLALAILGCGRGSDEGPVATNTAVQSDAPVAGSSSRSPVIPDANNDSSRGARRASPPPDEKTSIEPEGGPPPSKSAAGSAAHVSELTEWTPSPFSAVDVACKADDAVASLKNVVGTAQISMSLPGAGKGTGVSNIQVKNSSVFFVNYPSGLTATPHSVFVTADGKMRRLVPGGKKEPVSRRAAPPPGAALVREWATAFPRHALAGITERRRPFSEYMAAVAKDKSLKVRTFTRTLKHDGRPMKLMRIVISRTGPSVSSETVEMVFDSQIGLPVMIDSSIQPKRGSPTRIQWVASWRNNQKVDPSKFPVNQG